MKSLENFVLFLTLQIAIVACLSVSPKLDFDFDEQTELIQVKKEITGKIKGLKVTVDTSELKESKSSGESSGSSESGETKKKTVGVRTDVTFELTSGEDKNETKTVSGNRSENEAEDNASIPVVPVFKGKPERGGNNRGSAKDPNFNELWSVKPLDNPTPGQTPSRGGSGYLPRPDQGDPNRRRYDEEYPQYLIWTTERNHRRPIDSQPSINFHRGNSYETNFHRKPSNNFVPYQIHHQSPIHRPYQPCDCKEYPGPFIRPLHSSSEANRNQKVDDKLDRPFSKTTD